MARLPLRKKALSSLLLSLLVLPQISVAARALASPEGTYLPYQGTIAVPRPGQLDAAVINLVADIGVKQIAFFPPYSDLSGFIARKCGAPSLAVPVHPQYLEELNFRNEGQRNSPELLKPSPAERYMRLPACVRFVSVTKEFDASNGLSAIANGLGLAFDAPRFRRLLQSKNPKAAAEREYYRLVASPYQSEGPCRAADLAAFFGCVNAIEIAYLNRTRISAGRISGKITILTSDPDDRDARVAIARSKAASVKEVADQQRRGASPDELRRERSRGDIDNVNLTPAPTTGAARSEAIPEITAITVKSRIPAQTGRAAATPSPPTCRGASCPKHSLPAPAPLVVSGPVESDLSFVKAVGAVEKYGPDCAKAHQINEGRWPFDPEEFKRVLRLSGTSLVKPPNEFQRVLVVDSGFDFTYDGGRVPPEPESSIFPKHHFAVTDRREGTDLTKDGNEDGIKGNLGFAGVNFAVRMRSSETSIADDPFRSHGLAVTTLVLGGRGLQELRGSRQLPVAVGVASLVAPKTNPGPLSSKDLERIVKYATAEGNNYGVVNLSLSTLDELEGFRSLVRDKGARLVFVAAAGNEEAGKPLHRGPAYPAALGGRPRHETRSEPAIITVGAHDAQGQRAGFSNFGNSKVDVLAPGCMVPSYELLREGREWADPPRVTEAFVTGTSFAAPIVSFLAAVLKNHDKIVLPGDVKERILVGTNFDYRLRGDAYASGTINPAKVLGLSFDIIETLENDGKKRIRFGELMNRQDLQKRPLNCAGEEIDFADVKKLAFDHDRGSVLLMWNRLPMPLEFERRFCDKAALANIVYKFKDEETKETREFEAERTIDYIPKTD
jgi:hypothetical protein